MLILIRKRQDSWTGRLEKNLFVDMQNHVKTQQKALDAIAATIPCLQLNLISLTCQDPSALIASRLVLPAFEERLYKSASHWELEQAVKESVDAKVTTINMLTWHVM